jgi:predicted ATPase/transcriptional regulator with XRE-family HTH domain
MNPTDGGQELVQAPFATVLRRLRIAANLSHKALAEKAGISAAAVGAYERGIRAAPYPDTLETLAAALELSGAARDGFMRSARQKPLVDSPHGKVAGNAPVTRTLPRELTSFVGRETETESLSSVLVEQRMVTLTGPGGVGKTRVALRMAALEPRFAAAYFIDLGSVRESSRVAGKILAALPAPVRDDESADALAAAIGTEPTLLIMDNCEHLTDTVGTIVAALVRRVPNVTVLATSRQRLNISSEYVFRLAPLPYPDEAGLSAAEARTFAAVDLFVSRAKRADQGFHFADEHVPAVVQICRRVEGLPLAVELAAARLPMFGLDVLQERLRDRLGPLKANLRDVPERQQTFRATIDWSYELLTGRERLLLQRIAIFAGGCTLDAAETVCSGELLSHDWIVEGLSSLVDRSLVAAELDRDTPRYTLLDSTRQYALEKLLPPEEERLAERHAQWCAVLADDIRLATLELTHAEWAQTVLPELDNLYLALDWAKLHDRLLFAQMVGSLYFMWWLIGRLEEGRRLADDALSQIDENAAPAVAAYLYLARAGSLTSQERIDTTQRAIDLFERLGESRGLAEAYIHLASVYLMTRNADALRPLIERAADLVGRSREQSLFPLVLWLRGGLRALEGDFAQARSDLLAALEGPNVSEQEAGYIVVHELANVEFALGNLERAADLCDELALATQAHRLANHEIYALVKAAGFRLLLGQTDIAETRAREALLASRRLNYGNGEFIAILRRSAIGLLATLAALYGEAERAARLYGYVDARATREEDNQVNLPPACRATLVARLNELLSPAEAARHMRVGSLLSDDAAIVEALQTADQKR